MVLWEPPEGLGVNFKEGLLSVHAEMSMLSNHSQLRGDMRLDVSFILLHSHGSQRQLWNRYRKPKQKGDEPESIYSRNKIKHINMPILAENYQSFFFPGQSAIKTLLIIQTAPQFINMLSQTTIALGLLLAGASAQQAANCEYQSFKCGSVLLAAPFSKQYLIPKERQIY
jgi:hypothetical protein